MSFNRVLVSGAGTVVAALEANHLHLSGLPAACANALKQNLSDVMISQSCPPGFDNNALLVTVIVGGGLLVLYFFGKDILQEAMQRSDK